MMDTKRTTGSPSGIRYQDDRTGGGKRRLPGFAIAGALVLLVVALSVWWTRGRRVAETSPLSEDTVTRLEALVTLRDRGEALGRAVRLSNVSVARVTGDYVFWLSSSRGGPVAVVLESELSRGAPERKIQVRAGESVAVVGVVRKTSSASEQARRLMDTRDRESFDAAGVYVDATQVEVVGLPAQSR